MINPYPEYPTSKQDALNRVWQWFVVEKHPPGVDEHGGCVYRGPGGCMCGIGVMVPDADTPMNVRVPISWAIHGESPFALKLLGRVEGDRSFLREVQLAHDGAYTQGDRYCDFHSGIESALRGVAATFGLSIPAGASAV